MLNKQEKLKLLNEIKNLVKIGAPKAKKYSPPAEEKRTTNGGGGGGGGYAGPAYGSKIPAVQEMQVAIQNFAKSVTGYSAAKKPAGAPPAPGASPALEIDKNKKNFNNFITENYIATSGVKGVEWDKDPTKTKIPEKGPTELIEMDIVIDGLKRIGLEKSESATDGIWWYRTNNALKNIYAFAIGLINLQKDFESYQENDFTSEDLNVLKNNIPDDPKILKTNEDKIKRAEILTPLINKLNSFYKSYVTRISEHPEYRPYIEGSDTFKEFLASEKDEAEKTPDEQKMISNLGQYTLKNIKIEGKVIPELNLLYLSSLDDIKRLATDVLLFNKNQANDPGILKKIIDQLNEHIKTISGPVSKQKSQQAAGIASEVKAPPSSTERAFITGTRLASTPKRKGLFG